MTSRDAWLARIAEERLRQESLFGSEWDRLNTVNDWVALLTNYASGSIAKKGRTPSRLDFEETLVKTAAVALAALECLDAMVEKRRLADGEE